MVEYSFSSVNNGYIPDFLEKYLDAKGITYVWQHGTGDNYNSGVKISDGTRSKFYETSKGVLLLPVSAISADSLGEAAKWQKFMNDFIGV